MKKNLLCLLTVYSMSILSAAQLDCEVTAADATLNVPQVVEGTAKVLKFDGIAGHCLNAKKSSPLHGSFSYYGWIKPDRLPTRDVAAFISRPGHHVKLALTPSGRFRFTMWGNRGRKYFVQSPSYDINHWYQIVGVYNSESSRMLLYVNGRMVASASSPAQPELNMARIVFGAGAPANNKFPCPYSGLADRLQVFRGVLQNSEISRRFQDEAPLYGINPTQPVKFVKVPIPQGKLNFNDQSVVRIDKTICDISPDGKSLKLNQKVNYRGQTLLCTRPGMLKQNTIYKVTLRYSTANQEKTAEVTSKTPFFLFGCKSFLRPDIHHVIKTKGFLNSEERVIQFITKDDTDDYVFYIDLWNNLEGRLTDVEIRESRIEDAYIAATSSAKSYKGRFPTLPTGCPEFEIALPDGKGKVVNASHFGVRTDSPDNTEALQKAFDYCVANRPAKLIFDKGRYYFTGKGVKMVGAENLEIDFGHSDFIYYKNLKDTKVNITMDHCRKLRLRNLNADWDWKKMPLASLVEVVGVNGNEIDFKFLDYDVYPKRDVRVCMVSEIDPKTRLTDIENKTVFHMEFYIGKYVPETTWLSGNVLRIKERGNDWNQSHLYFFKKGQFYRMLHAYYEGGMFQMENSSDVSFEDINIYSTTGKNFHFRGMKNWQLIRVNCAPPDNAPKRLISSTADAYGHERCYGNFKMIDCRLSCNNDDFMNFQDTNILVFPVNKNTVRSRNLRSSVPSRGDIVELRDGNFKKLNYKAKVVSVHKLAPESIKPGQPWGDIKRKSYEITLDVPLPSTETGSYVLFNLKFNSGNAIFRNCVFENVDGSGRFQSSNVTIENCIFRHNSRSSLHFATGYTLSAWCEGYGVENVIVRNCTFSSAAAARRNIDDIEIDCFFNAYTPAKANGVMPAPIFRRILIENNRFENTAGVLAWINCATDIIFRNNLIVNTVPRKRLMNFRGAFVVNDSRNVYIVNNQYVASPFVLFPGVFYNPKTAKNLVAEGNRIVNQSRK